MGFGFLSGLFLGKWVGVWSMNGEFEDLSIGNKLSLNRARSGSERLLLIPIFIRSNMHRLSQILWPDISYTFLFNFHVN
jgi:hypothetical protein